MRIRSHAGLLAVLGLSVGGLTALALSVSAGAASGQVCMGVVVQDGSTATPSVQAANVDPGTSDLQAMSAAGDVPTQNNSGLVCAIDNFPADGLDKCLNAKGGKFFYWSYWQGNPDTNTWTYASVGPASHDVSVGSDYVEGWRYQDPGADNPTAPAPTMTPAAAFGQACTVTSTTTTSGGGGWPSGGGGGGGSGGPAPTTAPSNPPTTQPTPAPSGIVPQASGPEITTTTNPKGLAGPAPPSAPACSSTTTSTSSTTTSTTAVRAGSHQKARAPGTARPRRLRRLNRRGRHHRRPRPARARRPPAPWSELRLARRPRRARPSWRRPILRHTVRAVVTLRCRSSSWPS